MRKPVTIFRLLNYMRDNKDSKTKNFWRFFMSELIYVWCPYCHEGHGCIKCGTIYECVTTGRTFTIEESLEDIKKI